MKVALVMASHGEGGLEKHVIELANGFCRRGIDVCLIAHPMYRAGLPCKIEFFPIDLTAHRRNPFALYRLFRLLRQACPQIVHAHGSKAASMVSTLLPFLPEMHSVATLHSRKKNVRMFLRFERVIAVSNISTANLHHPAIRVIHNGITLRPPATPALDAWPTGNRKARVLALGRLVPVKGFDVLIKAWVSVDASLAIAGEGFERARLERLIRETRQDGKIILLGHRPDVDRLLAASDLLVISSNYEGCPYVLAEALHHSVPVISTAVGAMPEILPEAFTCPPGDIPALSERINSALADQAATKREMEPAFQYARTEMTLDRLIEKTTAIYDELHPHA